MKLKTIFLDGKMVQARSKLIDSLAPGIVQSKGVFETMRVYNGKIFALEEHFDRLLRGLKVLKIQSQYSRKQWSRYLYHTIEMNALKDARIRLAIWNDTGNVRMAIICQDIKGQWNGKYKKGITVTVSAIKRNKTRTSNIKSLAYDCFRRAYEEAQQKGFDEALLLNNCHEVVEGSRTNIFYVCEGKLFTPAIKCGCLNGITRQMVIHNARELGMFCVSMHMKVNHLIQADEVFVTNSLIGIMPVTRIEEKIISTGRVGAITNKLMDVYNRNVHLSCPS